MSLAREKMRKEKTKISKRGYWIIVVILLTGVLISRCVVTAGNAEEKMASYLNSQRCEILIVVAKVQGEEIVENEETLKEIEKNSLQDNDVSEDTLSDEQLKVSEDTVSDEVEILAHLIMGEADSENERDMYGVAVVAMNRVVSPNYPDTLEKVIFQNGQYACTWDGNFEKEPTERCYEIAREVLNGERYGIPSDVVYQAQFEQGSGIYDIVETRFGTHYYCHY